MSDSPKKIRRDWVPEVDTERVSSWRSSSRPYYVQTFPILELPNLAITEILKMLDLNTAVAFSLCSRKSRTAVKLAKLRLPILRVVGDSKIIIQEEEDEPLLVIRFGRTVFRDITHRGTARCYQMLAKGFKSNVPQFDREKEQDSLSKVVAHLNKAFNVGRSSINLVSDELQIYGWCNVFDQVGEIRIKIRVMEDKTDEICQFLEKIEPPPDTRITITGVHRWSHSEHMKLFETLLKIEMKFITFDDNLVSSGLMNKFVKKWLHLDTTWLHTLRVINRYDKDDQMKVFRGLSKYAHQNSEVVNDGSQIKQRVRSESRVADVYVDSNRAQGNDDLCLRIYDSQSEWEAN